MSRSSGRVCARALIWVALCSSVFAQTFVKVTDPANPIVTGTGPEQYSGASWVDFDGDGDLDLFANNSLLYRNDGGGTFDTLATILGAGQPINLGNGNSWGDYDNDGDPDCFIVSAPSFLYRNEGGGTFTKITTGAIGDSMGNRGWACAWADYNNDGYLDLAITHPANFVPGTAITNQLLLNNGPPDFSFTRITGSPIVTGLSSYTVGTWSDFDLDGDMDYFIGAGPVSTTAPDFLFRNMLTETGLPDFVRITTGVIATDFQDGQVWNWIDYDNDSDLDAYLTNYSGGNSAGLANRLYRNDGGVFTRISTGTIVTDVAGSLGSVWGDYDNDGDLDVYVTNDGPGVVGQQDRYYRNNGNGTFTFASNALTVNQTRRGATAGDYDNDGDLDIFAAGPSTARALYRNETANGNHWLKVRCVGTSSNRSAIGARIRIKATINAQPVWQLREVSAQNTFNGQNALEAHFGLGDATSIDSVLLEWPRGLREVLTGVAADQFLTVTEGDNFNVSVPLLGGWNIVSVPIETDDYHTPGLFPGASSAAFRFQPGGGYIAADTLENGTGYWIKYPSNQSLPLLGREIDSDTIVVSAAWNLIGSVSSPVPVGSIIAVGTSIVSPFYEYGTTGYTQTATLLPGRGYWVKVNDPGTLIITGSTDQMDQTDQTD